ncbi:MAG: sugar phosphate isomerase/epimerase [Actinomycetota bacterium]|nr:sugar phosphate isomerase/epimerase [Actinomycetota bacterium]
MSDVVRVPDAPIALSTASCYPESCTTAFEMATRLGYDGVEVMVWTDPVSQDPATLRRLSEHYDIPIVAIHAPTLLLTQRVWGTDPWVKVERSIDVAEQVGASTVVVHPPFRWQRDYARGFSERIAELEAGTVVRVAVENMFPWRAGRREVAAYAPGWDPVPENYQHVTMDLSHTATAGSDALAMLDSLGRRMVHLHLADGSGSGRDEHLVPGRGTQPCAEVLERLAHRGFDGSVVLEVNTRRAPDRESREKELAEALAFARLNFVADGEPGRATSPAAGDRHS